MTGPTPTCSTCGQAIARHIRIMYYERDLVYRTVTGLINARCPECKYNMRHLKVRPGHFYECTRCHLMWKLEV